MDLKNLLNEIEFKAVRSSGAGGQHVNKVSSKVVLTFDLQHSKYFSEKQKTILFKNLASRLTKDQLLILFCDQSRSQHKNKEIVIKRFFELIKKGLFIPKKRKPTKPSKTSVTKRLNNKQRHATKKVNRKKPPLE